MNFSRRGAVKAAGKLAGGVAAIAIIPVAFSKVANAAIDEAIGAFTGGAAVGEGGIDITAPEIAENGNTVPIKVSADGATDILILADGNPNPGVATFHFGDMVSSHASTRIRLAKTQNVIAVAKLGDGSFIQAASEIKVTIGGCGG